jgi:hypothetical protein
MFCWKVVTAVVVAEPKWPSAPPLTGTFAAINAFWSDFTASVLSPTLGNSLGVVDGGVVDGGVVDGGVVDGGVVDGGVVDGLVAPSTIPREIAVAISTTPVTASPRLV